MAISINIDFQVVPTGDPKYLLVVDTSEWAHIEGKPSIIEITLPGSKNFITQYFDKGKVNVFNSQNLGFTCYGTTENDLIDLPDGVYKITVKGSPDTFNKERYYLRTEVTEFELNKLFVKYGLDACEVKDKFYEEVFKPIKKNLNAAKANIHIGDIQKANYFLVEAQTAIENYRDCKDCK